MCRTAHVYHDIIAGTLQVSSPVFNFYSMYIRSETRQHQFQHKTEGQKELLIAGSRALAMKTGVASYDENSIAYLKDTDIHIFIWNSTNRF
jgi:ABC-type siderophore export system fused ATPase/permease subunit